MFSKEKTLGAISPDQFSRTLGVLDQMESWSDLFSLLKKSPRFKNLVSDRRIQFTWSAAYELEYLHVCAALILAIASEAELAGLKAADDKTEFFLQQAENDDEGSERSRIRTSKALLVFGLLQALIKSAECMSLYSVSINVLVARARLGDIDAMVQAIRVDPSVLSAPSVAHQLSLAVLRKDKRVLQRIKKAFDGPHKGLYPYRKLRYSALILEEAGALSSENKEHVFDVVANKLKLYEQTRGDPFKGMFTQFARWKEHAST